MLSAVPGCFRFPEISKGLAAIGDGRVEFSIPRTTDLILAVHLSLLVADSMLSIPKGRYLR